MMYKNNYFNGNFQFRVVINKFHSYFSSFRYSRHVTLGFSLTSLLTSLGLLKEEEKSELMTTMKRGEYLYRQMRYDDAERMFHVALMLAQQFQHTPSVIFIYDRLANIALDSGYYEKCIKLFKVVCHHLISNDTPLNHPSIIEISLKIGQAYEGLKDTKEAGLTYEFCINNLQPLLVNAIEENDASLINLWIKTTHTYSNYLRDLGNVPKAIKYLNLACETAFRNNSSDADEENVMLLYDLANLYLRVGDFENAKKHADKGVLIAKRFPTLPYIANFYLTFAAIALQKNLLTEALNDCRNALKRAHFHEYEDGIAASNHCIRYVSEKLKSKA